MSIGISVIYGTLMSENFSLSGIYGEMKKEVNNIRNSLNEVHHSFMAALPRAKVLAGEVALSLFFGGIFQNYVEKHRLQDALIVKSREVHPDYESKSDAEILDLIEHDLNARYSGRGIEHFLKAVDAVPKDKSAYKIKKLVRILVKE